MTAAAAIMTMVACGGTDADDVSTDSSVVRDVGGEAPVEVPPRLPQGVLVSIGIEGETELFRTAAGLYMNSPNGALLVNPIEGTIETVVGIDVVLAASDEGIVGEFGDDLVAIATGGTPVTLEEPAGRARWGREVAMHGARVVVAADGWFAQYDVSSGDLQWDVASEDLPMDAEAQTEAPRQLVVGAGIVGAQWRLDDETALVAFDSDDGTLLGLHTIPRPENVVHDLQGSIEAGRLIISGEGDFTNTPSRGWVRSIEIPTGTDLWSVESRMWFDDSLVTADLIAAPNQDGSLSLIEPGTGNARNVPTGQRVQRVPLEHERGLVMVTVDGEVLLVDVTTGTRTGEAIVLPDVDKVTGMALVGDVLYIATVQSVINNDNDPVTLWGIDVNSF